MGIDDGGAQPRSTLRKIELFLRAFALSYHEKLHLMEVKAHCLHSRGVQFISISSSGMCSGSTRSGD